MKKPSKLMAGALRAAAAPTRTPRLAARARCMLSTAFAGCILATPAWGAVTLTVAGGVNNPPANVNSNGAQPPNPNPVQTGFAYTASVVTEASLNSQLVYTLQAQGFIAGNGWSLNNNTVTLNPADTYNLTQYQLSYTAGAGGGFGEKVDFTLQNAGGGLYNGVPAGATEHWVNLLVESYRVNNFGFPIAGPAPIFKYDNGSGIGGPASGPGAGPYYDSNSPGGFSTPPSFYDGPGNYLGVGFYFRGFTFPTWDVYTAATPTTRASETIYIGDYGVSWGFGISGNPAVVGGNVPISPAPVPEASTTIAGCLTLGLLLIPAFRKPRSAAEAQN